MTAFIVENSELFSVLVYLLFPVLTLCALFLFCRRHLWLAVPIVAGVDLLVWGRALVYNYGEFRGIVLLFLLPQLLVTALIALLLLHFFKPGSSK